MLEKCPLAAQVPGDYRWRWGKWADRRQEKLDQMGRAHSTWLLRVVMGLWTSRERPESKKNSARRCEQHRALPLRPETDEGRPEEQKQNTSKR